MGHLGLRKIIKAETMYKDKSAGKHKCVFSEYYILKVIDIENKEEYYNVLKCSFCLSFKSISEKGNIQGHILRDYLTDDEKKMPMLCGNIKHYYNCDFSKLKNVGEIDYEHK